MTNSLRGFYREFIAADGGSLILSQNEIPLVGLQQLRVIRDHLTSKCLTSMIVFDIQVQSSVQ